MGGSLPLFRAARKRVNKIKIKKQERPQRPSRQEALPRTPSRRYRIGKRAFDLFFGLLGMTVLMPLLLVLAAIIWLDDPHGSPIFVQTRVGLGGICFRLYKLRTMTADAEARLEQLADRNEMDGPAFKIHNDPRVTRFGRLLRACNQDELPQLFNVIRGDMSIVGPRPPLPREVMQYTPYQMQRISVTPGMSCYWQTRKNRNSLSFDEWMELDLQYIRERSWWVDLSIIWKTGLMVLGFSHEAAKKQQGKVNHVTATQKSN